MPRRPPTVMFYPRTGADMPHATVFLPLSVLIPAAALERAGVHAEVIDQRVEPRWQERVRDTLRREPLFFGISAMTGPQIRWGLQAAELVREASPETCIVWGGGHASVLPEETLVDPRVDAVVAGQGIGATVELARVLEQGGPDAVRGRVWRDALRGREPDGTFRVPPIDYQRIGWRSYLTAIVDRCQGLTHVTSHGCPHRCRFCYNHAISGRNWRAARAEDVVDDLARLRALGSRAVLLFDDNFFVDRERAEAVADSMIARGIELRIKADCRADYLLRYEDAFLARLRRAGFESVFIGAESGSDRVLQMLDKGITVRQILEANHKLARAGIRPHYSFMAGLPGETEADVLATVRLMQRLLDENPDAMLSPLKGYVPYPGTELYEQAIDAGFRPPSSLEGWSWLQWQSAPRPWLSPALARLVDKMCLLSVGLDTTLFENSPHGRNPLLAGMFRLYSWTCRWRCARGGDPPMPELQLIRTAKRLIGFT